MKTTLSSWILVLAATTSPGLFGSEPPSAHHAPDATVVDPDHYSVVAEDERVRVLRIHYGPGESSVMHHHPESVAVFLTDHAAEFSLPDGSVETITARAREVITTPAGHHRPTNVGDTALELLLVELKPAAATSGQGTRRVGPDPAAEDPDHYSVIFENDRVRALRIAYGPGESSVMHGHPEGVAVFFTDHRGEFELPDGTTRQISAQAGEVLLTPAGQHRPTNLGDAPFELIQIELK